MARLTETILGIAKTLKNLDQKASFEQLGKSLNDLGVKTSYGTEYSGERGTAKAVQDTYNDLLNKGDMEGADMVATSFTDKDGKYSWNK